MRKLFTLLIICATSVLSVTHAQCVITAVPTSTAGYTPTQIVNGSFDV